MLIRSQNREFLINFAYSFELSVMGNMEEFLVTATSLDETLTMGRYSTREKAIKVLDMIQEAYADFEASKITSTGLATAAYTGSYDTPESVAGGIKTLKGYAEVIKGMVVFQMPRDREVSE